MIDFLSSVPILLAKVRVKLLPHLALRGPFVPNLHGLSGPRTYLQTLILRVVVIVPSTS